MSDGPVNVELSQRQPKKSYAEPKLTKIDVNTVGGAVGELVTRVEAHKKNWKANLEQKAQSLHEKNADDITAVEGSTLSFYKASEQAKAARVLSTAVAGEAGMLNHPSRNTLNILTTRSLRNGEMGGLENTKPSANRDISTIQTAFNGERTKPERKQAKYDTLVATALGLGDFVGAMSLIDNASVVGLEPSVVIGNLLTPQENQAESVVDILIQIYPPELQLKFEDEITKNADQYPHIKDHPSFKKLQQKLSYIESGK